MDWADFTTILLWFCIVLNLYWMIRYRRSTKQGECARLEYKKATSVLNQMIELHGQQAHFEKQWLDAASAGKQEVWEFYNGEILRVNQQLLDLAQRYSDD
jgi:hypothetical protein